MNLKYCKFFINTKKYYFLKYSSAWKRKAKFLQDIVIYKTSNIINIFFLLHYTIKTRPFLKYLYISKTKYFCSKFYPVYNNKISFSKYTFLNFKFHIRVTSTWKYSYPLTFLSFFVFFLLCSLVKLYY